MSLIDDDHGFKFASVMMIMIQVDNGYIAILARSKAFIVGLIVSNSCHHLLRSCPKNFLVMA